MKKLKFSSIQIALIFSLVTVALCAVSFMNGAAYAYSRFDIVDKNVPHFCEPSGLFMECQEVLIP